MLQTARNFEHLDNFELFIFIQMPGIFHTAGQCLAPAQTPKSKYLFFCFYGFHGPEKDQPAQFDAPGKTVITRRAQRAQQSTQKKTNPKSPKSK